MGCSKEGMEEGCCFQLRAMPSRDEDLHGGSVGELGNNNTQLPSSPHHKAFPKKARVDLSFENVKYSVREWTLKNPIPVQKEILHGVSGIFPAGELSAIMGPSGAGKSTLLNVLAAFTLKGASGKVMLNRRERDPVKFKKQSCYIRQDDYLRKELTVAEAMTYAADLKLGRAVTYAKRQEQIREVLEMLGLSHCWSTVSGRLSGGQKKRLSIALELISNPPVIFLDEPTTGLDSSSCSLCVSLLKFLATQGRTVVCTIHQPSSLLFEKFDNVYALAGGRCLYSGKTKDLIPYLSSFGLQCPQYHNPADFLLDVAIGDYGADLQKLAEFAEESVAKVLVEVDSLEIENAVLVGGENNNQYSNKISESDSLSKESACVTSVGCVSNFFQHTSILTCRKLRMIYRKPKNMLIRAFCHLFVALLFGYLYAGSGRSADTVLANYIYIYGSNLFLVYTGKMAATLLFPMELKVVSHEHFNGWYSLLPYYASLILIEVPFQVLCCWLYLPISFYLTGNPMDCTRLLYFCGIITALSLVSQAVGLLIGILTNRKIAVFLGPLLACLLSVFGFCIRYSDIPYVFRWLYHISYFRASFHVGVEAVYGLDRGTLPCPEDLVYCPFSNPKILLREFDVMYIDLLENSVFVSACFFIIHIVTFWVVWYKLNRR